MKRHILILVENLSVPFDRRVWQESCALRDAGFKTTIICPAGTEQDTELEVVLEGIRILRYPLRPASGGPLGYLREYSCALWHSLRLAAKVRRAERIDALHACNPPDLLFLVALALMPGGTRFVFDHHDLVPELFQSRFPRGGRVLYAMTRITERLTFACADGVISTNESYRRIAVERGKVAPDRVAVVRSAPDLAKFRIREADPTLSRGKRYLLVYLGVMGRQDGVDYALRALHLLRVKHGREDVHSIFMGGGDAQPAMVALSEELGLADIVEFTGRVPDEFLQRCLSSADVCLAPDPRSPLNDISSMNKIVEYMAMARPIVSFDLTETMLSAQEAAAYAPANDELAFAAQIEALLADPDRRRQMGELGRRRFEEFLSWESSSGELIRFYSELIGSGSEKGDRSEGYTVDSPAPRSVMRRNASAIRGPSGRAERSIAEPYAAGE